MIKNMKNRCPILCLIVSLFIIFSCSDRIDNYTAPSSSFSGRIIDKETGKQIQGQQPDGARIRMYEGGKFNAKDPIDFWVMQEGNFVNKALFDGTYKVIAEGPFEKSDTLSLQLQNAAKYDFKVIPFLNLTIDILEKKESSVVVKYRISQSAAKRKIQRRALLISNRPYVDINNYINQSPFINTNDISDSDLTEKDFITEITGLSKGVQYYIRSGARCNNSNSYYNYSEILSFRL
ncbi:hypothetical protein C1631_001485 [Chryseobacterium phosphatilyticum]|uniref:DUF3823 domain-containing protein n=2 Tax=Chryseobacterium phosphatilyticum TaxID=475075 RepID=A0A316XBW1_9FLAO|nr:hypothetical protein C1631_001485 [Chryseobacterium phosphatilyticum]